MILLGKPKGIDLETKLYGLGLFLSTGCIQERNILNFKNNEDITLYHLLMMFQRTMSMFEYGGNFEKSDKISKRWLEGTTQVKGYSCIHKYKGEMYCDWALLGGKPRYDYLPSKLIVNNPYTGCNEQLTIDEDCVMFKNDEFAWGLFPIHCYYATKLMHNDQSRRVLLVMSRAMQMLYSTDVDTTNAIKSAFKKLDDGELAAIFDDNALSEELSQIKSLPFGVNQSSQTIIQLLEDYQYNRGSWWNEMGVQSNYNMKRETITSSENILNVDSLLPFADNMLNARKEAVEKINKMFGLNWTVDFSSAWKKIRKEIKQKEDALAAEAKVNSSKQEPSSQLDGKDNKEGNDNEN